MNLKCTKPRLRVGNHCNSGDQRSQWGTDSDNNAVCHYFHIHFGYFLPVTGNVTYISANVQTLVSTIASGTRLSRTAR